ncbi:MAG: helix-turn-helix transcriptional regulator [Mycetocola sp.]
MWEERADHTRRDITALAASGLGLDALHAQSIRLVDRVVPTELTCWATIDPETLAISAMASGDSRLPSRYEPLLADAEYSPGEPYTFAGMARRNENVSRLSDRPLREQQSSARVRNVWRPLGLNQELRVLFVSDDACWGAAGLVRAGRDFSDREMEYLTAVAPAIASATRLAVRSEMSTRPTGGGPAIVVIDARGTILSATPEAQHWRELLDEREPGRSSVFMTIMATGARSTRSGAFRARVRGGDGAWCLLEASTLIGGEQEDHVAVSIHSAIGEQLLGMLLAAYGLSPREREVSRQVIAGYPTTVIAAHLFVTANTVQDHLKSVFAKVGVRSRGELVARLQPRSDASTLPEPAVL